MQNMRVDYQIPAELYAKTIHFLEYDYENKTTETEEFLQLVPIELRKELSWYVYNE